MKDAAASFLRSVAGRPAFWLAAQSLLVWGLLEASGSLAIRYERDSHSYMDVRFDDPQTALSRERTLGYPLLVAAVRSLSGSLAALPYVHFALQVAAVWALYAGLRSYGFARAAALSAASIVLYNQLLWTHAGAVLSDAAGLSFAILTVAGLLFVVGRGGVGAWVAFGLCLLLTYHTRPAYLFLVPLAPVLGGLLTLLLPNARRSAGCRRTAARLAAVAFVPLVAFCAIRWAVVGHFGLVSFGGYNLIGVTGQFLTPELAGELPEHLQPLARSILDRQRETPEWRPPVHYSAMLENYNSMVWKIAVPAAAQHEDGDSVRMNRRLAELGRHIIRLRPGAYIRWLRSALKHGLEQMAPSVLTSNATLLVLAALAACQVLWICRRSDRATPAAAEPDSRFLEYHATLLLAGSFALAKLGLVILIETPIGRYVTPAGVFWPTWLAVALADRVERVRGTLVRGTPVESDA